MHFENAPLTGLGLENILLTSTRHFSRTTSSADVPKKGWLNEITNPTLCTLQPSWVSYSFKIFFHLQVLVSFSDSGSLPCIVESP